MDPRGSSAFKMLFEGENQLDRILIILKKENGPRASSAPALGLNTIIFKYVYWYMKQISGERLQDHWSSGSRESLTKYKQNKITPYIRLVKFQLVRQIPDVYVSACVLAGKLFCCILQRIPKLFMV